MGVRERCGWLVGRVRVSNKEEEDVRTEIYICPPICVSSESRKDPDWNADNIR